MDTHGINTYIIVLLTIHKLVLQFVCSGELGVMNVYLSGTALDMPSPALSQRPSCQLCASTTVTVCVCVCESYRRTRPNLICSTGL